MNYKSLWDFLKATPKNLRSMLFIISLAALFIVTAILEGPEAFDPVWSFYGIIVFMSIVGFLGWLRVYLLYKKNKWK